jgi:LysM repeat protein
LNPWLRKSILSNPTHKVYTIQLLKKGATIYDWDETESPSKTAVDTTLFVSPAEVTADSLSRPIIHIVQDQETLKILENKYGVNESQLLQWNHLDANPTLKTGQEIIILRSSK